MLAMLILCLLVGVMTFFLVFRQGLFSTALLTFLSLAASLIAWNFYEPLANQLGNWGLSQYCPQTVSFLGLFALVLFALREAFDRLIKGNMKFHFMIDRIGSAFFGLIASLIIVGVVAVGIQMLPVSGVILGFNRCPDDHNSSQDKSLLPKADDMAVSTIRRASQYGFAGQQCFSKTHPDFLRELYMNRLAMDPASRREAAPDALKVIDYWTIDRDMDNVVEDLPVDLTGREMLIRVGFSVNAGSDNKRNRGARDIDGAIRFVLGNIRLVGYPQGQDLDGLAAYPIGLAFPGGSAMYPMALDQGKVLGNGDRVDLIFKWPGDLKQLPPRLLEFKRTAVAPLPAPSENDPVTTDWTDTYKSLISKKTAPLTAATSENAYFCSEIIIVSRTDAQPLTLMNIPAAEDIAKARDEGNLQVAKPDSSDVSGYRQAHFLLPFSKANLSSDSERKGLSVPNGLTLVLLKAHNINTGRFSPPVMVDVDNKKYPPVGWSAKVTIQKDMFVELAYDAKAADAPEGFSGEMLLKEKNVSNLEALFFYLIPNTHPIGMVGCRSKQSRSDKGSFFAVSGDTDVLLVTDQ